MVSIRNGRVESQAQRSASAQTPHADKYHKEIYLQPDGMRGFNSLNLDASRVGPIQFFN